MKNQPLPHRVRFALHGIYAAWRSEASFRLQCSATAAVVLVLWWRHPPAIWWALLLTNCGAVLAAELFNTALESALDHLHPERAVAVRIAKDCAAAAVLLLSLSALGVFVAFALDSFGARP